MKRDEKMQAHLDSIANLMFGMSNSEAVSQGICIDCKKPATEFRDKLSEKEYKISAFCQECQDKMW